ncbi:hypothetical protein D3C81_1745120 [compost metagenome]
MDDKIPATNTQSDQYVHTRYLQANNIRVSDPEIQKDLAFQVVYLRQAPTE